MSDENAPPPPRTPRDKPKVRVVPPYAAAFCLILGILLSFIEPLRPVSFWPAIVIGFLLTLLGAIVIGWAYNTFELHSTSFRIDRPATYMVTHGPYRFSRNPMYIGGAILYAGIAFLFDSGWALLLLIPLLLVLNRHVVAAEEAYLESKFGQAYLDYKARTRRWLF